MSKVTSGLAKVLGIKDEHRNPLDGSDGDPVTHGESVLSSETCPYYEPEPSVAEWLRALLPTGRQASTYFLGIFPFLKWIGRYNWQWLIGDLVAGVTVGIVVIPQSMGYAKLADLPVQYGLYSSFMGVLIYWFFATSKDITIGPVAVMSTLVGSIIVEIRATHPHIAGPAIASAISIICGAIVTFIGFARLGFIVEFIPLPAITAYMTGSAISIAAGQVPKLLGEKAKFDTRATAYKVIINTLKHLPSSKGYDAAMGVTALVLLYAIRFACNQAAKKQPHRAKLFFFISTLRTAFVLLFFTMISAAVNLHRKDKPAFSIVGTVPRGFTAAGVPKLSGSIISSFLPKLPACVIVLLIEHIAIAKSFGRVNNYTINPSQELIAIGITNLLGPFLGAYPATGSFSRTAIKSKSGVRTPFAGVITAVIVLIAIYALTAVFYYIPNASLSAVIIHAVGDLIAAPNTVYRFWRVAPLDTVIFFAGVFVTIFSSIENGIYTSISTSVAVLLFRAAKAQGNFLGKVQIRSIKVHELDGDGKDPLTGESVSQNSLRTIYLPIDHADGTNPDIEVEQPHPGIFIFQFSEGFNYPNASHYTDKLVETILALTRRTNPHSYPTPGDRPWNDPGPRRGQAAEDDSHLPLLQAIILDFSSVNNVDATSIQNLIDVRNQLDRHASPIAVQWHFTNIGNRWTKRALAAGGFGYPTPLSGGLNRWKPIFSVVDVGSSPSAATLAATETHHHKAANDLEIGVESGAEGQITKSSDDFAESEDDKVQYLTTTANKSYGKYRVMAVQGVNLPFFHLDITSALESAVAHLE